ncbi:hypothetical protein PHYPSEUDO_011329 [Phytophthora pseudosyringae]|uniref:FYVE-type domain-containing protein n=1 Tax=Phytophthora pseudosyringae TaxID=221518 RepID=A0A8T1WA46_9STRA|nr:hypothetical protein PHYPSEUDO_011329 [Phytophthora pseudosyringae]
MKETARYGTHAFACQPLTGTECLRGEADHADVARRQRTCLLRSMLARVGRKISPAVESRVSSSHPMAPSGSVHITACVRDQLHFGGWAAPRITQPAQRLPRTRKLRQLFLLAFVAAASLTSFGSCPGAVMFANSFPLPDDYFPDVQLSALQIVELEDKMALAVKNALADYDLHEAMGSNPSYGKGWKTLGKVADLTTARQNGDAAVCQCRIFGRLRGDYRNFINFFYAETSSQLYAWNQFMYGNAVDAAVLKNIHTSASGKPYMYLGIKWTCLQPFALVKKRDTCFLEYMAFTKDLRGRDVGVRVNMPLTLPECPPLPDKMKTKRMQMLIVSIVRPTEGDPSSTELFLMSQNDFAGFAVPGFFFKRLMTKMNDMAIWVDSKLISVHGLMQRNGWVAKKSRSECRLCSRDFSTTRRRQHCRLCGEVFCRQCLIYRGARQGAEDGDSTQKTFNVVQTKFCRVCVAKVRDLDVALLAPGARGKGEHQPAAFRVFADSGTSTKLDGEHTSFGSSADYSDDLRVLPRSSSGSELLETIRSSGERDGDVVDDDRSELDEVSQKPMGVDMSNLLSSSQMMRRIDAGASLDEDGPARQQTSSSGKKESRRTIDQCIAEQEDLLRRLMLAAQDRTQP